MSNENSMNNELYYKALGYDPDTVKELGGQELILADIMACLDGCRSIYIPYNCPSLEEACGEQGMHIAAEDENFDAVYWGTPTIVQDKVLFPECLADPSHASGWNYSVERSCSQQLTKIAEFRTAKRIITGLGTGDVTVADRQSDMGGGEVVSYKNFGAFEDWIIVRDLTW
jgi:hypothetical protein